MVIGYIKGKRQEKLRKKEINFLYINLFKRTAPFKYMGISLLSALEIRRYETIVSSYYDKNSNKHGFVIRHDESKYCRPIVSSDPIYSSKKVALREGEALMKELKGLDLSPQRDGLLSILGEETARLVGSVVQETSRH